MAISQFTSPGTRVLKNSIFKECPVLPKLVEGEIYTVERIADCLVDSGGFGVMIAEVREYHEPRESKDFGDEFTHVCFYYDLDMFDLPALPRCLMELLEEEMVPQVERAYSPM